MTLSHKAVDYFSDVLSVENSGVRVLPGLLALTPDPSGSADET